MSQVIVMRNELSLQRLRTKELYINLMKRVESIMDDFRFNFFKAKTTIGHALACSTMMDFRELDSSIHVNINVGDELDDTNSSNVFSLKKKNPNKKINEKIASAKPNDDCGLRQRTKSSKTTADKNINAEEEIEKNFSNVYRPFGLLEPLCAKHARQNIDAVLPLLCELANLQHKIHLLNASISELTVNQNANHN